MERTMKAKERLAADFRTLIKDGQAMIDALEGDLDDRTAKARGRLEATLNDARREYENLHGGLNDAVQDAARAADGMVRDKPWHAMGLTFGLGLVVGLLLNRK